MQFKTITEKNVIGKLYIHMERVNWTGSAGKSLNFTGKMLRISNKVGELTYRPCHISEGNDLRMNAIKEFVEESLVFFMLHPLKFWHVELKRIILTLYLGY